jgi:Rrf2 family protein
MQFTKAEEYGLFGLIHLANQPPETVATLREISRVQKVPDKFLAKIFQSLTRAGIIHSHRGVRGGFSLAKPAKKISVAEIFEAIHGDGDAVKCVIDHKECGKKGDCPIRGLFLEGRRQMFNYFGKQNLQALADRFD